MVRCADGLPLSCSRHVMRGASFPSPLACSPSAQGCALCRWQRASGAGKPIHAPVPPPRPHARPAHPWRSGEARWWRRRRRPANRRGKTRAKERREQPKREWKGDGEGGVTEALVRREWEGGRSQRGLCARARNRRSGRGPPPSPPSTSPFSCCGGTPVLLALARGRRRAPQRHGRRRAASLPHSRLSVLRLLSSLCACLPFFSLRSLCACADARGRWAGWGSEQRQQVHTHTHAHARGNEGEKEGAKKCRAEGAHAKRKR